MPFKRAARRAHGIETGRLTEGEEAALMVADRTGSFVRTEHSRQRAGHVIEKSYVVYEKALTLMLDPQHGLSP